MTERDQDRRDARAAGLYGASRAVAMAILVAVLIAANHAYDAHGWQHVAALLLLHETALALGCLGLPDAVFYFLGRDPARAGAVVRQTSALLAAVAVPVIAIALGVGAIMDARAPSLHLGPALPWLALALLGELPTLPAVNQLIAVGRVSAGAAVEVGFAALRGGAILAPAIAGWSLAAIPVGLALVGAVRLAVHLAIVRAVHPRAPAGWLGRARLVEMARFAIPTGLAATVGRLNLQLDKYVVELTLGAAAFGTYTVAAFELPLIAMIPHAIAAVVQVRYVGLHAAGDRAGLRRLWYRTVVRTARIVVPLAVLVIVVAPELIELLFADRDAAAATPLRIFTAILLHRVAAYGPMLQATGQPRVLLATSLVLLAAHLALTVPLTRAFGLDGAALAAALACLPAWLLTLTRIGAALGGGLRVAMPWRAYARIVAVAAGLGVALALVPPRLGLGPGPDLVLAALGYGVGYAVLGSLAGLWPMNVVTTAARAPSCSLDAEPSQ